MQTILHIALSNAAVAMVLAVLALAVSNFLRRPALSHAAWLLVLLKLLTPPIFTVTMQWPAAAEPKKSSIAPSPQSDLPLPPVEAGLLSGELIDLPVVDLPDTAPSAPVAAAIVPADAQPSLRIDWPLALVTAWASGSTLCLILIIKRIVRFRRILRFAAPASDDVQQQVRALCADLDIEPAPGIFFVPGGVCPMLIGVGRASRILIPRDLWTRLEESQRATLLIHELAHLRRGDQWVRLIELLVTILYWWNPVAWLARRELREAEEQCCDAWVVFAMPRSARDYAVALMEAIELTTRARPVAPLIGSGMGEFHHLRRRLIMIKHGQVARALTWRGFIAMFGLGALLLPLAPIFAAQEKNVEAEKGADDFSVVERLEGIEGVGVVEDLVVEVPAPVIPPMTLQLERAGRNAVIVSENGEPGDGSALFLAEVDKEAQAALDAELAAANEVVRQLSQELARAQQRLRDIQARRGIIARGGGGVFRGPRIVGPRGPQPGAEPGVKMPSGEFRHPRNLPDVGPTKSLKGSTAKRAGDQPDRLDALEQRLAELLDEVRSLKQQRGFGSGGGFSGSGGAGGEGGAVSPQPEQTPPPADVPPRRR